MHGQGGVAVIQVQGRGAVQHHLQQLQHPQAHEAAEDQAQSRRRQGHRSGTEQEIGMHVPPGSAHPDHGAANAPLTEHQQIAEQHQKAQSRRQTHARDDLHQPQHVLQRLGHGGIALVIHGDADGGRQILFQTLDVLLGQVVFQLQLPQREGAVVLLHIDIVPDGDIDRGLVCFIGGENTADGIGILRVEALPGPIAVGDQGIFPHRQGQGQIVPHGQAQILGHRLRDQAALAACGIVCALCQGQIPLLKGQQVRRPVRGLHRQGVGRDLIGLGHLLDARGAVQPGRRAVGLGDVQHIGDAGVYPVQLILPHGQLHV